MNDIFIFWDKDNDDAEFLFEDGEFWYLNEDSVRVNQTDGEEGRDWIKLNKFTDVTPLNEYDRFDVMDPETGDWVATDKCSMDLVKKYHRLAGDPDWETVC